MWKINLRNSLYANTQNVYAHMQQIHNAIDDTHTHLPLFAGPECVIRITQSSGPRRLVSSKNTGSSNLCKSACISVYVLYGKPSQICSPFWYAGTLPPRPRRRSWGAMTVCFMWILQGKGGGDGRRAGELSPVLKVVSASCCNIQGKHSILMFIPRHALFTVHIHYNIKYWLSKNL